MKKKWFSSLLASTALVAALASSQAFAATNDGWVQSGNQWNLYQEGKLVKDGWAKDKGTWYFFDNNGVMQTGWVFTGGAWYSLNGDGAMRTGWYQEGNTWYYLSDQGDMQTGWTKVGDKWSYFESNGSMVADQPVKANDGRSYVIGKDGYMLTDTPYHLVSELYRIGGDEYLLHKSKNGVYIAQNEWYLESNARLGKAGYNLLVLGNEQGEVISMKRLSKDVSDFNKKDMAGLANDRIMIDINQTEDQMVHVYH